jgi:hypothetical protein
VHLVGFYYKNISVTYCATTWWFSWLALRSVFWRRPDEKQVSSIDSCQSFTEPWRTRYCPTYASFTPESHAMLSAYKIIIPFVTPERVMKLLQQSKLLFNSWTGIATRRQAAIPRKCPAHNRHNYFFFSTSLMTLLNEGHLSCSPG